MRLSGFLLAAVLTTASIAGHAADLRYGAKDLPARPGNPYTDHVAPGNPLAPALFDGLTAIDRNGDVAPALALRWKLMSPTSWQFVLRRGVRFSNGEPFNAQAVVAVLDWLRAPEGARTVVGYELRGIVGVEAPEDDVVVIRTAQPDALLPARLADAMIVAPAAWAGLGPETFAQTPVGTGPFVVKDWGGLARVVLEAQANAWRKPKVDRLIVRTIPDKAARLRALIAGEIDIAADLDADDVDKLEPAGLLTAVAPATAVGAIVLRQDARKPALRDARVRQALNHAVDKAALAKAQRGLAIPAGQPAARNVRGYNPDVAPYAYDPTKAKALLDDAGFGDGFTLRLALSDASLVAALTGDLARIGIAVEPSDPATADGIFATFESAPLNDVARAMEMASCLRPDPLFCDEAIAAKLAAGNAQMDADTRLARLADLAKLYHDAAPAIFLTEQPELFGVSRKLEGFILANHAPVWERIAVRSSDR